MSTSVTPVAAAATALAATSPVVRAVHLFVAASPGGMPQVFDPSLSGRFNLSTPPAGWLGMGRVQGFKRDANIMFADVHSGAPALLKTRGRSRLTASLSCTFTSWSKLALLLSSGSQSINLLRCGAAGAGGDSGGGAETAMPVLAGSTATVLQLASGSDVNVGDAVVVDVDYAGATGPIGSGIAGSYLQNNTAVNGEVDYVRRVSLNVGRVVAVAPGSSSVNMTVTLALPLLAGTPSTTMKLAVIEGFTDRLGGSYVSEWSALFVLDGVQGDRVLLHYPRLQSAPGNAEVQSPLAAGLERWRLQANFAALPVTDPNDGEAVLCFRSYLPAPMRAL